VGVGVRVGVGVCVGVGVIVGVDVDVAVAVGVGVGVCVGDGVWVGVAVGVAVGLEVAPGCVIDESVAGVDLGDALAHPTISAAIAKMSAMVVRFKALTAMPNRVSSISSSPLIIMFHRL
jgi:hypothetical protein